MKDKESLFLDLLNEDEIKYAGHIQLDIKHDKNKIRQEVEDEQEPIHEYVNHFSELAEMLEEAKSH